MKILGINDFVFSLMMLVLVILLIYVYTIFKD